MKNYKNLDSLKDTYNQGELGSGSPIRNIFKRLGRKTTFWYINPFGEKQNGFNKETAEMINELAERTLINEKTSIASRKDITSIMEQIKIINDRLSFTEARERATDEDIKDLKIADLNINRNCESVRADMNDYISMKNPSERKNLSCCFEVGTELTSSLISDLTESEEEPELEEWGESYRNSVMNQLAESEKSEKTIAVICRNFKQSGNIEAVRSEALELYKVLKKSSRYRIKFISIENSAETSEQEGEILYIPSYGAGNIIKAINPVLCVFCESTPHIILVDNCSMLLQRSVFKLSAQNPLQSVNENAVKELVHLNDFGLHKYLVQSEKSAEILTEEGFHEPVVSYPIVPAGKVYPRRRIFEKSKFTVGFASSPMEKRQIADRGINLLCELMHIVPDVRFEVLWRYNSAKVPKEMLGMENCRIIYGKYDMQEFYSSVDCVIIPYESIDSNHACSLSGVEAMYNGIPVLCTDVSGISEVVRKCGMGEVSVADPQKMAESLRSLIENYSCYNNAQCRSRLEKILDNSDIVYLIEQEAEKASLNIPVTLHTWNQKLVSKDKYLVKGHQAIKEYYQQQEIAEKYTETRFTSPALKYFDFIERQNIGIILDRAFPEKEPNIIDIACGDGRITSECIKHGSCTSADASPAMLNIVKQRFENDENRPFLKVMDIISDDVQEKYDAVTCFRYIRHFEYITRKLIYRKIRSMLKDGGIMIIDVPDIDFELPLKKITGWENYNIYDVFWTRKSIEEELKANGFRIKYVIPTGQGLMKNMPPDIRKLPMTWTIGAVKDSE